MRRALATLTVGVVSAAGIAVGMAPSVSAESVNHQCKAEIVAAEDGSWDSGRLIFDGQVVNKRWVDRMPEYGWRPGYKGVACELVVADEGEPTLVPTVTITKTVTETKTKTLMRVVKRTVVDRQVVTSKPPVGYVLTPDGRLVKVWVACFKLRESEVRPGSIDPDYVWEFCDADQSEWQDPPK